VKAIFVELPAFEKWRSRYLNDDQFQELQQMLMENPEVGDVIAGADGVRDARC
jgi:hypothetical protein